MMTQTLTMEKRPYFAILRTEKIKKITGGRNSVKGCLEHLFRERLTPNADPARHHLNQVKGPKTSRLGVELVQARLDKIKSKRKDAVLAIEYLITARKDWFEDSSQRNSNGTGQEFLDAAERWLKDKHGEGNIISLVRHYDETTPHLSALVLPITKTKTGAERLSCRTFLGGPELLSEMQTDFAKSVADFGLHRGVEGSKAKHEKVKRHYGNVNKATQDMSSESHETILSKAIEHDQVISRATANERTLIARREVTRIARDVPMRDILARLGFEPAKNDPNNYNTPAGRITLTGSKFFNHDIGSGGGGSIDLLQHLQGWTTPECVRWIGEFSTPDRLEEIVSAKTADLLDEAKSTPLPDQLQSHELDRTKLPRLKYYCGSERKLLTGVDLASPEVTEKAIRDELLWIDRRENLVAPLVCPISGELTSYYLRGTNDKPNKKGFHGIVPKGSKRGIFRLPAIEADHPRVICESVIDALTLRCMGQLGEIIATAGALTREIRNWWNSLSGPKIVAMDNDEDGRRYANQLNGEKIYSESKDWNQDWKNTIDSCAGISGGLYERPCGPTSSGSLAKGNEKKAAGPLVSEAPIEPA